MKSKIIFIASYAQSLINFRLELMKTFLKRGFEVIAIAPFDEKVMRILAENNMRLIALDFERNGMNPLADILLLAKLWRILRAERPTFVFSYTIKPVVYGSIAAKLARIPHIYSMITGTGYVFLNHDFKTKVVGIIAKNLFRAALFFNQLVFFQNKDNLHLFKQTKIISRKKKTAVINGSGVNCEEFYPEKYPNCISFLMIARLIYDKGIREYLQAAQTIKMKFPHVNCQLVGWIDTNPNAISQDELDQWVQDGTINYLGKLEDVRPAIANASVYILPSYHEGTPRTVLEAMAMARPIITTDAPGCRETVVNNKNGFLVSVKNVDEICTAMEFFINNPKMIFSMGEESRKIALEKYDVQKVNDSILSAMQL